MKNESTNHYEQIEKYCLELMDDKEKLYFEIEIEHNPALKQAVTEHKILLSSFDHLQNTQFIHTALDAIHSHSRSHTELLFDQLKLHVNRYWRTASVAASVAFVASFLTFFAARTVYKKETQATYQKLSGNINTIIKAQKDIKNEVALIKKNKADIPTGDSKSTGTGFALSQNGYLVTNLHVIDGYKKIFVFTNDNVGHQSEVIATDESNDLAILKITESDFEFKEKIPYSVRKSSPAIAQRVYSLGYPKEDIVYNEGYISSITGFEGDSSHYQLELPSGPGVSGAPIIDEFGNVIGIISGKQSQSEGITYAIKSKSLLNLLKQMPEDFTANGLQTNLIKSETRSSQVKKIQPFVCVVKVYN
ncbi:MAG TPA: serine protease [Chitinophagaceae bacterium]|nr:serine protease [Chitinophagaceae bacterium]